MNRPVAKRPADPTATELFGAFDASQERWDVALAAYDADQLDDAFAIAQELGTGYGSGNLGWFRSIEAEWITRQSARTVSISDWLTLEADPEHVEDLTVLGASIQQIIEEVATRFGMSQRPNVLACVLVPAAIAPWTEGKKGLCIAKNDFFKLLLPPEVASDAEERDAAVGHEAIHVVTHCLSEGRIARWLDEAIAMMVEGPLDERTRKDFADGTLEWLEADDLEADFHSADEEEVWLAYEQAAWIGRYLLAQGDSEKVGRLLKKLAPSGTWSEFRLRLMNERPEDAALKAVFGFDVATLFDRSLAFLRESR